jgi:hypothetical protein
VPAPPPSGRSGPTDMQAAWNAHRRCAPGRARHTRVPCGTASGHRNSRDVFISKGKTDSEQFTKGISGTNRVLCNDNQGIDHQVRL